MSTDIILTDMSTEYRLIVSTNTWLWGAQIKKRSHLSTTAAFFCPQGDHCGEVQLYLKISWRSQILLSCTLICR